MPHQIVRGQFAAELKQGMIRPRGRDEFDIEQSIAEKMCGDSTGNDYVGAALNDGVLGARQHRVGQLNLGRGTRLLQLRDDLEQARPRKRGVHHEPKFRLPALFQAASQELQGVQIVNDGARPREQRAAVRRQYRLSAFDFEQRDIQRLLQPGHGVADGGLAAMQFGGRLGESPVIDHGREHCPLLQCRLCKGHR